MKKLLAVLFILNSFSIFAFHPGDGDFIFQIGVGTKLKIVNDINVVPNTDRVRIGQSFCYIKFNQPESFDRVLKAGKELTILKTATKDLYSFPNYLQYLYVDNVNIKYISCGLDSDGKAMSLGLFQHIIKNYLKVILANPVEI